MMKIKENIQELRKICQFPRREIDTWHGRHVCRPFSIYMTRVAILLGISANTVTLIFFIIGLLACFFFTRGTGLGFLAGALTLQFWYLVDMVDGEVARYRKETSATGSYFDKMGHYAVNASIFFGLGFGIYREIDVPHSIVIGFIAGISIVLISASEDLKQMCALTKAVKTGKDIRLNRLQKKEEIVRGKGSVLKRLFSLMHMLCTFPTFMNVIMLSVVLDIIIDEDVLYWNVFGYAVLATFVWMSRLAFNIKNKSVDKMMNELIGNDTQ
jgi:phosphatidylglycerophosphate synthase